MNKQPNEHHICGLCGQDCQTLHGRACVDCQIRVTNQTKRYLELAQLFTIELTARLAPAECAKLFPQPAYKHNHREN